MERLNERIMMASKALNMLGELAYLEKTTIIERDACIQRFEFSFEACWKAGKQYLYDVEGLDPGSPKGVIRMSREVGILTEEETITGLEMVNHRNLTVHTYNEAVAVEIFQRIPDYHKLLKIWLDRIQSHSHT